MGTMTRRRTWRPLMAWIAATALAAACAPATKTSNGVSSQTAGGVLAYLDGDPRSAERLLRSAVAHDRRDSVALFYLAQSYLARGTTKGRIAAEDILDDLCLVAPDRPAFLTALSELRLRQGYVFNARAVMRSLEQLTPDDPDLLYRLGRLAERDFWRFQTNGDLGRAQRYYENALVVDPDHVDSRVRLAVIALELDSLDVARRHGDVLASRHAADGRAQAVLGVLYERLDRFTEADRFLRRALRDVGPTERDVFLAPMFLEPDSSSFFDSVGDLSDVWTDELPDTLVTHLAPDFWFPRDPTPGTPLNERWVVHAARTFMADFLYGDERRGKRGWNMAPGEFYIRYGKPLLRRYRMESMPMWVQQFDTPMGLVNLAFVDYNLNGEFMLPITNNPYPRHAALRYSEPEFTDLPARIELVPSPFATAWFRSPSGQAELRLTAAVTAKDAVLHAAVFDSTWREIYHAAEAVSGERIPPYIAGRGFDLFQAQLFPGPGADRIQFTLTGAGQGSGEVPDVLSLEGFGMSDLVLGYPASTQFIANPGFPYRAGATIGVRFEVYDTLLDALGVGYVKLSFSVVPDRPDRRGLARVLLGGGDASFLTTEIDEEVTSRRWPRTLQLDTQDLPPGDYRVVVRVEDTITGDVDAREVPFTLL